MRKAAVTYSKPYPTPADPIAQSKDGPGSRPRVIQAVSIAIRRGPKFLLALRGREPAKGLYAFPGGKVRPSEELEDAARREALEETDLVLGKLNYFRDLEFEGNSDHCYRLSVFISTDPGGKAIAGDDAAALGWYTPSEMSALPMTSSTEELARIITEKWPLA